jgi:hypothetical protein
MKRKFKRAQRTSPAPAGPDPQLLWLFPEGDGVPVRGGAVEAGDTPHPPIVRGDGSVVPRLSFEEGLAWVAMRRAALAETFVC